MGIAKHLFIPHQGNKYHPEILHSKRTFLYSLVFISFKAIIVTAALLVPHEAYLLPDVLQAQANRIMVLTNAARAEASQPALRQSFRLVHSADLKAADMIANSYFSHTGPSGHTLSYFLHAADYPYVVAGENLAMGFTDAQAVMTAWQKSPAHQANLVDHDYTELGVAVELGMYQGEQTVFMVQHFGMPSHSYVDLASGAAVSTPALAVGSTAKAQTTKVLGATSGIVYLVPPLGSQSAGVALDRTASRVYWQAVDGGTSLSVRAKIFGAPKWAQVAVHGISIELTREATSSPWFVGRVTVPQNTAYFFKPVILPTITMVTKSDVTVRDAIDWYNIQVPPETPLEQYFNARDLLPSFVSLFVVSRTVFLAAIIVFSLVLLVTIAARFREREHRFIFQTLFMLVLLTGLWWI